MDTSQIVDGLVSSKDVNGTEVYSRKREHVGEINHLVIEKRSGKVVYAIMTFGGFLGLGKEEFTIPWASLKYDTNVNGFVTDITPEQLKGAPARPENWYRDRGYEEKLYDYYDQPYYWI